VSQSESSPRRPAHAARGAGVRAVDPPSTESSKDSGGEQRADRSSHGDPRSASPSSLLQDYSGLARSDVFASAVGSAFEKLKESKQATKGSWRSTPGLSELFPGQGTSDVGVGSGIQKPPSRDGLVENALEMGPNRPPFDEVAAIRRGHRCDTNPNDEQGSEEPVRSDYRTMQESSGISCPGAGLLRDSPVSGFPRAPGTYSGIEDGSSEYAASASTIDWRGPDPSTPLTQAEDIPTKSTLAGFFGEISPEAAPQIISGADQSTSSDSLSAASLKEFGQSTFGPTSIDLPYVPSGGSRAVGEVDGRTSAAVGIDPLIASLAFPGHNEPSQAQSAFQGQAQDSSRSMNSFGNGRGKFGLDSSAETRGTSSDLTKTNDLLQQLLDEVRKERPAFLPMNDRNANY
jgi:hypothetical protein